MKRILTIVILTLSSVIYGQLQNFNSGTFPPVSPNVITTPAWGGGTYSGDPATWYRSDDLVVNGTMGNNGLDVGYGGSGNCAVLYSNIFDGYSCCGFQVDMIINNIDMSAYAAPQMKFYIKHPDGDEQIQIAVSNMGGAYNLLQTISSNYTNWTMVTVDLSAYVGSNDVTIRFRGVEGPSGYSDQTNVGIDEILIGEQTPMIYMSSTTSHVGCGLKQGYNDQKIMRIDVNTQGSLNPLDLTELMMNTNGSSDDCNDVVLKKIYSTGTSSVFNTSNLIGSSDLTGDYTISGNVTLNDGTNYFWVACDIPSTSTVSNVVDAECTGLVINSITETPTVTAPAGNLVINNTGVFTVTNLNNSGAGSLRSAISSAYSYGCGDAIVDATGVTGTISWGAKFSGGPDHDVKIIGSGADQLIVDGGGADGFLYHYGDGSLSLTGLQVINCAGSEIIYKPGGAGDLVLEDCWFNNNTYRTVYFVNTSGSFSASNCSFSNNSSSTGTMYLPNIAGSINFSNCTFYNNSSSSTAGVFYAANVQGGLTFNNCTLLNNSSGTGTGGIQSLGGSCTAINTTFENTPKDFTGQITMNYSHMSNTTGATISGANNILNVSANLLAMTNNGGTTPTCAINVGSPLINAGTANIEYDQRGYCRPNTSDIGAHEYNGVQDVTAPVPDIAILLDVTDECSVSFLTYPTATENCASTVIVRHDACLPITVQGTTVVTWTYDDGNGNTSTQTQNVVIDDITDPVADVASLTDVTDECSVAALVAPTATDNCAGSVIGTHNASLPITAQGTTLVTWTYDDGNGNIITQDQNVVITDITDPVTDVASLADVTDECSVAALIAPTATDNCAGSVIGTHNASLPITAQGTTLVTWTYDDGNGNIITQDQNVVITDITDPVADVASLTDVTECFESTPTAPTAIDNCAGALTATPDISFPIMTAGTTVVTWTYDDGNGNTSTQTQNVIVNTVNVSVTQTGSLLTADVIGAMYQWLDCDSNNVTINGETNQSYTPTTVTGNYAVEVTENGCVDTSACFLVDYAGIDDLITTNILVYPNPSNDGYFTVQYEGTISKLVLLDMFGRIIEVPCNIEQGIINASTLEAGKYILHITANQEVFIEQIVIVK